MRFRWRKHLRFGPLQINLTEKGYSSFSLKGPRWSWNSRTRRHTIDTPGPGYIQTDPPERKRRKRRTAE